MRSIQKNSFLVIVLLLVSLAFAPVNQTVAQDKAVLVAQFDMEKVYGSETIKSLGKDKFFELMDAGEETEVLKNLSRIDVMVAAPGGRLEPESLVATKFLVVIKFKDEAIASRMEKELRAGFVEDEIDGKKVLRAEGPGAPPIFANRKANVMRFGSREFLFANPESLIGKDLQPLLKQLGDKPMRMAMNFDGAREFLDAVVDVANENADFMSRQYISLLTQISTVQMSWDDDADQLMFAKIKGHDEDENKKIKLKIDAAVGLLKGFAEIGLAEIRKESPPIAKIGKEMVEGISVKAEKDATLISLTRPKGYEKLLLAAFKDGQRNVRRVEDMNKMRQAALAKHNYYDVYRKFPFDPEVTKNLSWRVQVLPYMEQERLIQEFNLKEKWSSEQNRKLIGTIPATFRLSNGATISYLKPAKLPKLFDNVIDGTSNTIVFVENRKARMIPWTKPEGVTPKEFIAMVEDLDDDDHLLVAFYDGSIRKISNRTSKETLKRLCDPADGDILNQDDIK